MEFRDRFYLFRRRLFWPLTWRLLNVRHLNLDLFRHHCDFFFTVDFKGRPVTNFTQNLFIENLKTRNSVEIYVGTPAIESFENDLRLIQSHFSVNFIIDDFDQSLVETPTWILKKSKWAAPHLNNPIESDGLCLPVGVTNRWMWQYGRQSLFDYKTPKPLPILCGPFGQTHPSRNIFASFANSESLHVLHQRISPRKYSRLASNYKMILCPRGNGLDTHRLWETLYRGSVPIAEDIPLNRYFKSHGVPMYLMKDLREVQDLSIQDVVLIFEKFKFEPKNIPSLWPKYWFSKLNDFYK